MPLWQPEGYQKDVDVTKKYIDFDHVLISELSGENAWKNFTSQNISNSIIEIFLDWQFSINNFQYLIISAEEEKNLFFKFFRRQEIPFPKVCLEKNNVKEIRSILVKQGMKGFRLVIATSSSKEECHQFFSNFGYLLSNSNTSILNDLWNKKTFKMAVEVGLKLGGAVFCCFAHDGDPVYILERDFQEVTSDY